MMYSLYPPISEADADKTIRSLLTRNDVFATSVMRSVDQEANRGVVLEVPTPEPVTADGAAIRYVDPVPSVEDAQVVEDVPADPEPEPAEPAPVEDKEAQDSSADVEATANDERVS